MTKILVIHGPNLDRLGEREPEIYGKVTLDEINRALRGAAKKEGVELEIHQSDHEGEIVRFIAEAKDKFGAILINPAAYTHTSVAVRDALSASSVPAVEVHLSNIYAREEFRRTSLTAPVCAGQIVGFGMKSYLLGLEAVVELLKKK